MPKLSSFRNQSIDSQSKSIDWFLYAGKFDELSMVSWVSMIEEVDFCRSQKTAAQKNYFDKFHKIFKYRSVEVAEKTFAKEVRKFHLLHNKAWEGCRVKKKKINDCNETPKEFETEEGIDKIGINIYLSFNATQSYQKLITVY